MGRWWKVRCYDCKETHWQKQGLIPERCRHCKGHQDLGSKYICHRGDACNYRDRETTR